MLFNADVALMSSKFGCLHFYLVEPLDGRFNGVKNNEHVCVYPTVYTYIIIYIFICYTETSS